jgi:phospholipid/cholesterol/gamma-HCH transport system permease protein
MGAAPARGPAVTGRNTALMGMVSAPAKQFVDTIGAIVVLTSKTLVSAVRGPYPYGKEFVSQFLFALRMCWMPMIVSSFAFTYGPAGIQSANFLSLFGALDRLGGLYVLLVVREFAPFVCALVVAGVAGTAICADLGARKVREELDALLVLGVDPVKNLVVPRFLALALATAMFNIYSLIFGTMGGVLATLTNGAPLGPFWATYFNNASTVELGASLAKTAIFGGAIAVVCCYKGLTASGGAEGVGRAVNQAVVISFMAIGVINFVFTQTLLALNPLLSVPK